MLCPLPTEPSAFIGGSKAKRRRAAALQTGQAEALPLQIRQIGGIGYNEPRRYWVLTIRLARYGKKKAPSYRVVVIDKRRPRNGRFVEIVGTYNPLKKPAEIKLDAERIQYWLGCGAQPSDTVRSFLRNLKKA